MQLLAGTDAGTGVRGRVRVWGEFCCSAPQYGWDHGGGDEGHTQEHTHTDTGTYMQMLHLPFSDLPLKKKFANSEHKSDSVNLAFSLRGEAP